MREGRRVVHVKDGLCGSSSVSRGENSLGSGCGPFTVPMKDLSVILKALGNMFTTESHRVMFEFWKDRSGSRLLWKSHRRLGRRLSWDR